jgi:hypothetical protein
MKENTAGLAAEERAASNALVVPFRVHLASEPQGTFGDSLVGATEAGHNELDS